MPEFNWKYSHPLTVGTKKYLAVVIEKTPEVLLENMKGVAVKFSAPNGEIIAEPIDLCYGLGDNLVFLFKKLTPVYKPVGFVDPQDDLASFGEPVWVA